MSKVAQPIDALNRAKLLLFTALGIAILLGSAIWALSVARFVASASSAEGVVTRLNAGGSHPQVRFTTAAGEVVEYPQGGLIFGYQAGDRVRVLYNTPRPAEAVIDTFGARWGFPLLSAVMGVAMIGAAQLARRRA